MGGGCDRLNPPKKVTPLLRDVQNPPAGVTRRVTLSSRRESLRETGAAAQPDRVKTTLDKEYCMNFSARLSGHSPQKAVIHHVNCPVYRHRGPSSQWTEPVATIEEAKAVARKANRSDINDGCMRCPTR